MKKHLVQSLTKKIISETLQDKAQALENKIKNDVKEELGGMDDSHPTFGNMSSDDLNNYVQKLLSSDKYQDDEKSISDFEDKNPDDSDDDEYPDFVETFESEKNEGEMCSECSGSGMMNEIECNECGGTGMKYSMKEGLNNVAGKFPKKQSFDYVEEETDVEDFEDEQEFEIGKDMPDEESCMYHKMKFGPTDERTKKFCIGLNIPEVGFDKHMFSMNENLKGNQKKIDANKNNKIDAEDFKLLRNKKNKKETTESLKGNQKKIDINNNNKIDAEDFELLRKKHTKKNCKDCNNKKDKKSLKLKESELVELISLIVEKENKKTNKNIKSSGNPPGLKKYEQSHKASGKENSEYLKSLEKKMKEYLKDGSKGKFETNPDFFPKGNGDLSKMNKKAYVPSSAVKDYTDNLTAAALENLDYDEIHPDEKWVEDNVVGSSRTGNNPKWANTGQSEVNKKRNEIRKKNMLAKIKRKAYNKSPQPVLSDKSGEDEGNKLMMKLESKKIEKINEEFSRINQLIGYNKNTQ